MRYKIDIFKFFPIMQITANSFLQYLRDLFGFLFFRNKRGLDKNIYFLSCQSSKKLFLIIYNPKLILMLGRFEFREAE